MPYLPTTQSYLEQSSLLLQAYPDTVRNPTQPTPTHPNPPTLTNQTQRITTKYTFPRTPTTTDPTPASEPKPRIATLELKTFHPGTGICLKYKTNKGAEVGRLITSLGKLAAGADVEGLGLGNTILSSGGVGVGGDKDGDKDVVMGDVSSGNQGVDGGEGGVGMGMVLRVLLGKQGKGGKEGRRGGRGRGDSSFRCILFLLMDLFV
ncbi:hypothetical protein BO94DRAFT_328733 [Aspergillus sclerotioniger CBS 115572]|uniref:SRP9 domain-containing protein n=1 Tax=Aspergillus sclerotioniger CBS 115572 TaxID=1450535 RepID=A0A317X6Y0_9EURO|nr:hypothetical protein BO94DRAFT_328733 [Aspergillus sclerotioniger CBS 115572]PWY94333.1 hypothetical protein BO94DRAFT_328733 [Aspergillus sclerotioniger CBS 115572]